MKVKVVFRQLLNIYPYTHLFRVVKTAVYLDINSVICHDVH